MRQHCPELIFSFDRGEGLVRSEGKCDDKLRPGVFVDLEPALLKSKTKTRFCVFLLGIFLLAPAFGGSPGGGLAVQFKAG